MKNTTLTLRLFAAFLLGSTSLILSAQETNDPETVIHIGKNREVKSLNAFFEDNQYKFNVHLMVDAGDYYAEEIWVRGEHITIEGVGKVNLYCTQENQNVMWVTGSHITIRNLRMKHQAPGSIEYNNCTGRVLAFDGAHFVTVEKCNLNGCGLSGLHDNLGNSDILIRKNFIHHNSVGAYTDIDGHVWFKEVDDHPVFTFVHNRMVNNGPGPFKRKEKEVEPLPEGE
jgi:hypothetical protein